MTKQHNTRTIRADAKLDGEVDASDVSRILRIFAAPEPAMKAVAS